MRHKPLHKITIRIFEEDYKFFDQYFSKSIGYTIAIRELLSQYRQSLLKQIEEKQKHEAQLDLISPEELDALAKENQNDN